MTAVPSAVVQRFWDLAFLLEQDNPGAKPAAASKRLQALQDARGSCSHQPARGIKD